MERETMQVLEMVANGTVTPEQGAELLGALTFEEGPRRYVRPERPVAVKSGRRHRGKARPSVEKIYEAGSLGVNTGYINEMRELGFGDLSLEELIELRTYGVDRDFIEEMREAGLIDLSLEELTHLAMYGVDGDFVRALQGLGYVDLTADMVVDLYEGDERQTRDAERDEDMGDEER